MEKRHQVTAIGLAMFNDDQIRRGRKGEKISMMVDFEMKNNKWQMSLIKETNLEQLKKAAEEHSGECRKLKENLEIFTRSLGQDKKYIREASSIQYRMNYWSETDMVAKIPGEKTCLMSCPEHYNCVLLKREWHFTPIGDESRCRELRGMTPINAVSERLAAKEANDPEQHDCKEGDKSSPEKSKKEEPEDESDDEDDENIENLLDANNKIKDLKTKLADSVAQIERERAERILSIKTLKLDYDRKLELLFHELEEANKKNLESASLEIRLQMQELERNSDKGLIMVRNNVRDAIEEINELYNAIMETKEEINRKEIKEKVDLRRKLKEINYTLQLSLMSLQQEQWDQVHCKYHQFDFSTRWFTHEDCIDKMEEAHYAEKP